MKLTQKINRKVVQKVVGAALTVTAGTAFQTGCGDLGGLGYYDPGFGMFDPGFGFFDPGFGGGFGPIDSDAFDRANDAWSDYIRM